MKDVKILSIDFSLSGSAFIYGNINSDRINYVYFSGLKKDINNNSHCIKILPEYTADDKLDYIITYYINLIEKDNIQYIFLEAPSFNSINTSNAFKEGYGLIKYFARQNNIPYLLIPPISNKLFFTENSKATKDEMVSKAIKLYENKIDFGYISKKHCEDVADALSLYTLGREYLLCNRLLVKKGCVDARDIKYFETLPLHQQQVIAKLYNREDLYKEIVKRRSRK